jgi:hypothetical protein
MTIPPVFSRKDLVTLFDIRDNAFHLLVQKLGEQTPLIYASSKRLVILKSIAATGLRKRS